MTSSQPNEGAPLTLDLAARLAVALRAANAGLSAGSLSDYSAANVWLFRRAHDYCFVGGEWPHLSGRTYDGERHVLPLFPVERATEAVWRSLLRGHDGLFPIAEAALSHFDPVVFRWEAHRDDADYLYPTDHFRHYRGEALGKKRNLMRQFLATHRVESIPYATNHAQAAQEVLDHWMREKGNASGEADDMACREALTLAPSFGLTGHLYLADDAPAGFVLGEALSREVFVLRFAKGLRRYKGIAHHMFHHLASALPPEVEWLNLEQDLGLANLRRTKLSYQPAALLAKYRVRLHIPS